MLLEPASPQQLAERTGTHQLPQWQWTLERCHQWEGMLEQCRSVDRLLLLVDLPPESVKEAILLSGRFCLLREFPI